MSCMFDQSIIHRSISYIWPMFNFQIISRFESCVRPSTSADVNENLLSEQGRTDGFNSYYSTRTHDFYFLSYCCCVLKGGAQFIAHILGIHCRNVGHPPVCVGRVA